MLAWNQSEPGANSGEDGRSFPRISVHDRPEYAPGSLLSSILEIVGFTNSHNQRTGGNRANTWDLADMLAKSILPITLLNLLVECSDDIEQVRHVVL